MNKHNPFDIEWFTILHHPWPPMPDKHVIEEEDGKQLPRSTIHKRKSSRERMRSLLPEVMVVVGETGWAS